MKILHLNYKKNPGIYLVILGMAIWLIPFALVAIDNLIGTTKPADSVINNGGVFLIIVGPLLFLIGVALIVLKFALKLLNRE